jgi:MFS family permease
MVSTTRADAPAIMAEVDLPYGDLTRQAPVAVAGCIVAGIVSGSFYALIPAWMQGEAIAQGRIALFMLVAVLGGLAFQVPVGRLSDRRDRRLVLVGLALGFAVAAVALVLVPRVLAVVLPIAALLGGFMSTLYPVCVSHALDRMPSDRVVAVSGRLILVNGVGSAVGPLIGTAVMSGFDIDGLLYFMAAATALLALVTLGRIRMRAPPERQERPFEILAPQAAPIGHDPTDAVEAEAEMRPVRA